jgi:hypothetical protein
MRQALFFIVGCGLIGAVWACGGASEPAPAAPETPAAEPEPAAEPAAAPESEPAPEPEAASASEAAAETPAPSEAAFQGKGKETAVLGSDSGAKGVTNFNHWKHQQDGAKCVQCHHKGAANKSCGKGADCHQFKEVNAPSAKDAFHKGCNPCHKKKGLSTGCDYCHQPKQS